ncbi:MAG: glutamate/cysteine ligase family protein [Amycolatopsis sp.]|uniref:ergothioneine biosynthesis glutamate--cysteine ligase EgtA n=1 Tax=Amycolatopsis sp. TaxID=37632 RepID=UPI002637EA4F|nr:ergothioneine biosynthesis glutamate--cysteine ligase EgtA [Amycolatopsis sp.]MCU1680831.1 glutamate/cysteine ligase family protein [Amycolatopsis sp.]
MTVPCAPAGTEPLTVDAAFARAASGALVESEVGTVGLEAEAHLVALDSVSDALPWSRVEPLAAAVHAVAGRSAVTLEPGGQVELSGLPAPDITTAVSELRADVQRARLALADLGLGLVYTGSDPVRPGRRINPHPRYRAMEQHFRATGRATPGAVMMNSTAAIQVNLQAGPADQWIARIAQAHRLGPTLVAISACSPWLSRRDTGWKSARQRAWAGLGARTAGPVFGEVSTEDGPAAAWARYALRAPVMFVQGEGTDAVPVRQVVSFERWASGEVLLDGRAPTAADLDVHLTTLFPPVRLRGYLELRYLDMTPARWWPAVAATVSILMDDPVAADLAAEATEPATHLWEQAARDGLEHPVLAESARRCLRIAADRAPHALAHAVADLAELVEAGRCPGDLVAKRVTEIGPHAAFQELAHA